MRFVCDSCRAQYMISDEKVGAKGVKVRCKKCGFVILVRRAQDAAPPPPPAPLDDGVMATQVMQNPLTGPSTGDDEATVAGGPETTAPGVAGALVAQEKSVASQAQSAQRNAFAAPAGGSGGIFAGVEEDEIGAVFDQVLNSGTHPVGSLVDDGGPGGSAQGSGGSGSGGLGLGEETNDDRLSTRVLDAETVRKLAEEAAGEGQGGAKVVVSKSAAAEPERHDWFVAIDEAQVGPLTLEKVKGHWDAGEIGPDSLCWRAGFSDWMPLSEVAELAPVLAPQPKKPVIVGSGDEEEAPTVPPGPVESAFSARPRAVTPAQVPAAPVAAAGAASGVGEDAGGWKPSAASALASLVKEEIEALARPPEPKPEPAAFSAIAPEPREEPLRGLLELPSEEHRIPDLGAEPDAPSGALPAAPAAASAGPASAAAPRAGKQDSVRKSRPAAPPPPAQAVPAAVAAQSSGLPRSLLIGGAVMLALVVVLVGAVLALAFRDREGAAPVAGGQPAPVQLAQAPAPVQPVQPAAAPAQAVQPAAATQEPAKAPEVAAEAPKGETSAAAAKSEEAPKEEPAGAVQPAPAPAVAAAAPKKSEGTSARRTEEPAPRQTATRQQAAAAAPAPAPAPREERTARTTSPAEAADDFDAVFGGGGKPASRKSETAPAKASAPAKGSDSVYIPPAPGSSTGPQRLGQSDIMAVVLQNKSAIQRCVTEQKSKDPSVSGTLVMQWSIRTNGSTEKISVQSTEFRSTHVATCMGGLIRGWRFPAHQEQGEPINFPFKF